MNLFVTPNPGFVLIFAAIAILAVPRGWRATAMAGAALLALWLLLDNAFGAARAMQQVGLRVELLNLDELNRIFGIAMLLALAGIAVYSGGRRNRSEDAAILLLAGCAVAALFLGDLITFVAAAALGGLASAWIAFASPLPGASRSGARLMIWHGLEGLLFLVGVAFHLAARADSAILRQDATTLGGAFLLAALLIRVGAPLAHVWFKDAVAHASPVGAVAVTAFTSMLGLYALARMYPAEPLLVPIGAAMIGVGAFYAAAEDDLRKAGAYGQMAQMGLCVALVGVGSPLAMAAAEAHAFALTFAFAALHMAFGAVVEREGAISAAQLPGLSRRMPLTAALMTAAGLLAAAVPGSALYATHVVTLNATAQWDYRWLWAMALAASAVLFVSLAVRPSLGACRAAAQERPRNEAPFPMLLGAALAVFFSVSVGLAPHWLYNLMPTQLAAQPFALDRLAAHLQLLGAAGAIFVLLRAIGVAPGDSQVRLLDIDALYRGPLASAGRWAGVLMLRGYGAWRAASARASAAAVLALRATVERCDRPYLTLLAGPAQFLAVAAALLVMLFAR